MTTSFDQLLESEAYTGICRTLAQQTTPRHWDTLSRAQWLSRVTIAEQEGVAPILYWHFKQQGWPSSTPDEARTRLTSAFYAASAQNALLLAELGRIAAALTDNHITVVAVKGAALVYQLYPNIGLRPMGDIDLLVQRSDINSAARILEHMGYERTIVQSERLNRLIGTQLGFTAKSGPDLRIEIHWSLVASALDRRAPNMEWFWSQIEPLQMTDTLKNQSLLTLSPTAHLLYIAAHMMLEHSLSGIRLLWLHDVQLILSRWAAQVEWDELFSQAAAFGWADALTSTLQATATRFSMTLPKKATVHLIQDGSFAGSAIAGTNNVRGSLKVAEHGQRLAGLNTQARLWYALAMIFPSPRYMRAHYGQTRRVWWPLLYVVRWAAMIRSITQ